jgi:methyltransferase
MTIALTVLVLAVVPMLLEAARSRRNELRLRRAGAIEPEGDVHHLMRIAYPAGFLAIAAESWVRNPAVDLLFVTGLAVFLFSKLLKYWAIATLGDRWSFRVLVPPDAPLIVSGPYRYLRHPNYAGVAGEFAGAALMAHAPLAGTAALLTFGALMLARIRVEERALDVLAR